MDPIQPVSPSGFEYYNNESYVVIPPFQRHRRRTVSELRYLFGSSSSGSDPVKDKPAYWCRAQPLHYGLGPTNNKGIAVMRLLNALSRGEPSVPEHLRKLEDALKRECQKNTREERRRIKNASMSKPKPVDMKTASASHSRNAVPEEAMRLCLELDALGLGAPAMAGSGSGSRDSFSVYVSDVNSNYYVESNSGSDKPSQDRGRGECKWKAKGRARLEAYRKTCKIKKTLCQS
ncbi:hypothetical protein BDW68DRAFT_142865 [Aspergillus falconensis]